MTVHIKWRHFLRSGDVGTVRKKIGLQALCWAGVAFVFLCQFATPPEVYGTKAVAGKAVIVDQLSLSSPNPVFVKETTTLLKDAGYEVDYYEGKEVTVDLFRALPQKKYDLIILRVHSAYIDKYQSLAFFTSEPYDKHRYVYEQLRNRVARGYTQPHRDGDPEYLTITDKFVRYSMEGSFNDALVIMMGCSGIKKRCAANAFLQKGARAFVGWNGLVSASYTDRITIRFLENLLAKKQPIFRAAQQAMEDGGQEPKYQSTLLFWPIRAANYVVLPAAGSRLSEN